MSREATENIKSDVEKIAKGGSISLVGSVVGKGLFFLIQLVIIRLFGAEVFGLYVLGLAVARLVEIVSRFGLDIGSMKFVSIYHKDDAARAKGTIINAIGISICVSILTGILLYSGSGFIAGVFFGKPELTAVIRAFAFCIPFMSVSFVAAGATQGFHTTKYAVYIKEFIQPISNISLVLIFSFTHFELMGVVYAFVISYILAFLSSLYFLKNLYSGLTKERTGPVFETKNLLAHSIPLIFISVLNYLLVWTDILMLGYFLPSKDVSIYRAASLIPFFLTIVLHASNSIYAPMAADLFRQQQKERFEEILKTTTRWIFNITLPALIIMVFFSKSLMLLFGAEFVETGSSVLIIWALAQFVNCGTGGVGYTLVMTGRQKLEFLNSSVLVLLNIILNYLFIPRYGIIGAAGASGVSIALVKVVRLFEVKHFYGIHPYNKNYFPGLIAAGISTVILYLLSHIRILSGLSLFTLGLITTMGMFILSFSLSVKTEEDKHILFVLKKFSGLTVKENI